MNVRWKIPLIERFRHMMMGQRIGAVLLIVALGLLLTSYANVLWQKQPVEYEKVEMALEYLDDEKRFCYPSVRMKYNRKVEGMINQKLHDKAKRLAKSIEWVWQHHPDWPTENDSAQVFIGRNEGGILSLRWEENINGRKHPHGMTFDLRTGKELSLEAFAKQQKDPREYSMEAICEALAAKRIRGEIPMEWQMIRPNSDISYFIGKNGTLFCWERNVSEDAEPPSVILAAWRDGADNKLSDDATEKEYVSVFCGKTGGLVADVSTSRLEKEDKDWRTVTVELSKVEKIEDDAGKWKKYAPLRWRFWQEKTTGHIFFSRMTEQPDGEPQIKSAPHLEKNPVIQRIFNEAATEKSRGVVVETVRQETGETFSYPVVRLEDKEIEATINEEIEAEVREFYERGQYFRRYRHQNDRFSLDYTIGLNDGERLSLVLHQRFHYAGAPLEHMEPIGMTFDLATGQRLDLEDYDEIAEDAGCPEAYLPDAINLRARQAKGLLGDHVFARDNNRFFISEDGHVTYLFERVGRVRAYQTEQGAWDEETTEAAKTFFIDLDAPMEMAQ